MPFKSQAQRKWMYANHPEMAQRWEAHTKKGKKLPEKLAFWKGFEKQAGIIDKAINKVKSLFTGKEYLYHGTSAKNAKKILKKGLRPNHGKGITDAVGSSWKHKNKDLVFLSRDKDIAKSYAKQQAGLDGSKAGKVLKIEIPKEELSKRRAINPEIKEQLKDHKKGMYHTSVMSNNDKDALQKFDVAGKKAIRASRKDDVAVRGGIGKRHIKEAFIRGFEKQAYGFSGNMGASLGSSNEGRDTAQGPVDPNDSTMVDRTMRDRVKGPKDWSLTSMGEDLADDTNPHIIT